MSLVKGGNHLGVVRSWMQWHASNGSDVTWGSNEYLKFMGSLTVSDMEHLAQDICNGVMEEYKIKAKDHKYKYAVVTLGDSGRFSANADTKQEVWNGLFGMNGSAMVCPVLRGEDRLLDHQQRHLGDPIFKGTIDEVLAWCRNGEELD